MSDAKTSLAIRLTAAAAAKGDSAAAYTLSLDCELGRCGQPQSAETAYKHSLAAASSAAHPLPSAMFDVGHALMNGDGVTADPKAAMMWYEKASKAGHTSASFNLGTDATPAL